MREITLFLEYLYGNICTLAEKGFSENAVIKAPDPENDCGIKWVAGGNVGFTNRVRSAMASIK